ncbi:MAG: HAD family hydrolase [Elusimicrobia bacterium]|nr:HAD family hydrolase [Elusimicrobiota bacterium]
MKILLFDLDGTLVKAGGAGRRALDRAMSKLYGIPNACAKVDLRGRTDLDNFTLAYRNNRGKKPTRREISRIERMYLKFLPGEVKKSLRHGKYEPVPGVQKFLRILSRKKGVLLGLGTGNVEEGAWIKLAPLGLGKYFSFGGFGADSLERSVMLKKAFRRAQKLMGSRNHVPHEVFVIGDTHLDVRAGKKAGFKTAALTSGFGDSREIRATHPDFIAKDFRNTKTWFSWLRLR